VEYPDQLKVRVASGRPYPHSLEDLLDEAAARDPAVEEVLAGLGREGTHHEFVRRATRHLLAEGLLPAPGMVYRTVRLLAEASPLTAGDLNWPVGPFPLPVLGALAGPRDQSAGRDVERTRAVRELTRRPSGVSLLCISGPAAVGKTRLADEIMKDAARTGFTWLLRISLRPARPGSEREELAIPAYDALLDALVALGIPQPQIPARLDARQVIYQAALKGRRPLILLDGAVDESQVLPLLPAGDGAVVVTSRRPLSGLSGWRATQRPLHPLDRAASRLLIQRCFRAAGQEPDDEVIAAISGWGRGNPVPLVAVSRWMITTASREEVSWKVLTERFESVRQAIEAGHRAGAQLPDGLDADITMNALFSMLNPAEQLIVHMFGSLPVTFADIPTACLSTGLSQDQVAEALEQLINLGWVARRPHGGFVIDGHVAAYARVAGAPGTSAAPSPEQAVTWLVSRTELRLRQLRELMTAREIASRPAVRAWVYERWRAERESAAAVLEVAAGTADAGQARGLSSAFMDIAVLTNPAEDGWRETQRFVAPILRIARAASDRRLEAMALWRFGADDLRQGASASGAALLSQAMHVAQAADDAQLIRMIAPALEQAERETADLEMVTGPADGIDDPDPEPHAAGPGVLERKLGSGDVPRGSVLFGARRARVR
jgi:hypothetical protein